MFVVIIISIIIILSLTIIYLNSKLDEFTNYPADIINYDTPLKAMLKTILDTINKKHTTDYHLVDIDSYKKEDLPVERYTVRFYAHNMKLSEGSQFIVVFTVGNDVSNEEKVKNINVEHINISNAVVLPNNIWTNNTTRNGMKSSSKMLTELISVNGLEDTTLDYKSYKTDGICLKNIKDYYQKFNPDGYNDKKLNIINNHAVSYTGITPFDNPTVARKEKLDYQDPISHLFSPNNFSGGDGNVAY